MPLRAEGRWLMVIVVAALAIRIYFPWPLVFAGAHVNLLETDAWYHLRVIENLVQQFPYRLGFDPYALTDGASIKAPPLLDLLIAGVAYVAGWGAPSELLVKTVAVFTPPVLGALTVIAVFGVARLVGGSVAGLLAAAMAAMLPGHFLDRTLLGYVDHHALEALVSTVILWILARHLARPNAAVRSGVWLGAALIVFRLTWTSSAMFVGVLIVWIFALALLQSWRAGGVGTAARVAGIGAIVAGVVTLAFPGVEPYGVQLQVASLGILFVVAGAVELGRHGLAAAWWSPRQLVLLSVATAAAAVATVVWAFPSTVGMTLGELSRFSLSGPAGSVIEARPLFMYSGTWSLWAAWDYFRTGFMVGLGALVWLTIRWARRGQPLDLLLIVWTTAMYAATIGVNRFGYYLVPAIAVVGGCGCAALLDAGRRAGVLWRRAAVVVVAAGVFGVNLVPAIETTVRPPSLPATWLPAFDWLRHETDEPFGDPDYYRARYDRAALRSASSTVMIWWDYGYALMAAAHRVPVANPTGAGAGAAAAFFTAVDEGQANAVLDAQRSRHVFMDHDLPFHITAEGTVFGKFQGVARWAGVPDGRFFDVFHVRVGNDYQATFLFFEDYYRTMAYRLGVLAGQAVVPPEGTEVVSWAVLQIPGVGPARVVSSMERHSTYEAAAARLAQLGPGNHAIVGRDPRVSPVPLGPVSGLQPVYATPDLGVFGHGAVQVFERRR